MLCGGFRCEGGRGGGGRVRGGGGVRHRLLLLLLLVGEVGLVVGFGGGMVDGVVLSTWLGPA